jgi:hypothetical protein
VERMSDLALSLVNIAMKVIFKETFTALIKRIVSRTKERIVPIGSKDDSVDDLNSK